MKTEVGVRAEVKYEKPQCCLIRNKNNSDLKQKTEWWGDLSCLVGALAASSHYSIGIHWLVSTNIEITCQGVCVHITNTNSK